MTFTAAGTIIAGTGAFTLTPAVTGDVIALFAWSSGSAVTALSSANVNNGSPWTVAVPGVTVGSETVTAFLGTVTGTGGQTLTPTVSGSPTLRLGGQELHSSAGASSVMLYSSATLNATGTAWPSLTALAGQCYIGFEFNAGSATGGSTSGFVYQEDPNGNGLAYKLATAAGANSPVWGDSDARDVLALLLYEAVPPAAPRLVPPGISSPMAYRRHAWPSMAPPLVAVPDTGGGADAGSVTAGITSADTGSAADTATGRPGASDTDAGSGADASAVTATLNSADTGGGADAGAVTATLSSADAGSGTESTSVTVRPLLLVRWNAPDKLDRAGGTMGGT